MKSPQFKAIAAAATLIVLGAASPWLLAQESAGETASADAAAPAATAEGGESAAAAAPATPSAVPMKPRASEIMPLTSKSLMLDVTNTGKHLIAVGDRGAVLVSNNGADWAQVQTPVRSPLTAVSFADENTGWAVGHDAVILKTTDGGKTWVMQNFQPELEKPFLDVVALDANTVIAVGAYGLLYKTTDGGTTWAGVDMATINPDGLHFNGIAKLKDGSLLTVGEQGMLGHTTDGGATWTKLPAPYEGSFYGALPFGDSGAIVFGLRGNVFKSTDLKSGQWTAMKTDTVASFFGGINLPDGGVALVGLAGAVLKLDASGNATQLRIKVHGQDALGNEVDKDVTGSFSAAAGFAGGLLVVGEQGIQSLKL